MRKILLVLALLLPLVANSAVEINGIYYNLIPKTKIAKVTENPRKYFGDIIIPSVLLYNDIEYSVTTIEEMAFSSCNALQSVTIPNSVTIIEGWAFEYCGSLRSITIPNNVNSIGNGAFSGCKNLLTITIPNSVLSLGQNAFAECTNLQSVIIGDGITTLNGTFDGCTNLSSVTFGKNITTIEEYAFSHCKGLSDIVIPNSVNHIKWYAFYDCSGLKTITIPNSVTSIGSSVFEGCSNLQSISIPNNVTSIGNYSFKDCCALTSVQIPAGVTNIGMCAFYNCTGLKSLSIPNSVTTIESSAFENCVGLNNVTIGKGLKNIYGGSFSNCHNLTDFTCLSENAPLLKYLEGFERIGVFQGSYIEYATLHVPKSSIQSYKTTVPWSGFGTIVSLDDEEPEAKKCAKPTISYTNGNLKYECTTEGVQFISEITDRDIKKYFDAEISLTATYNISVYATKEGYENSDVATATLCWIDVEPMQEGTKDAEDNVTEVRAMPVLIQTENNTISVQGTAEGTDISVYNTDGMKLSSTIANKGITTLNVSLPSGSTAIVKIGEKAVKVLVK